MPRQAVAVFVNRWQKGKPINQSSGFVSDLSFLQGAQNTGTTNGSSVEISLGTVKSARPSALPPAGDACRGHQKIIQKLGNRSLRCSLLDIEHQTKKLFEPTHHAKWAPQQVADEPSGARAVSAVRKGDRPASVRSLPVTGRWQ
jgi:hypothetical protein